MTGKKYQFWKSLDCMFLSLVSVSCILYDIAFLHLLLWSYLMDFNCVLVVVGKELQIIYA